MVLEGKGEDDTSEMGNFADDKFFYIVSFSENGRGNEHLNLFDYAYKLKVLGIDLSSKRDSGK